MAEDPVNKNLRRAGEYFVCTLWLQNQMVDLIILGQHPRIVPKFVQNATAVPYTMVRERMRFWSSDFRDIKDEFLRLFCQILTPTEKDSIEKLYLVRNAIGHSSVSLGRSYLLYRPNGRRARIRRLLDGLDVSRGRRAEEMMPRIIKLDFKNDATYRRAFRVIQKLDEDTMCKVAKSIGISHSRVR